jgi:signal transduction histidine kinase
MKITTKLILAFLIVTLLSTGFIALFARISTNSEFNKFINDRYKAELVTQLANYYKEKQAWDGVESLFSRDHFGPDQRRPLFFSITDESGVVLVAGNEHKKGEKISEEILDAGAKIEVNNEVVGILLLNTPPDRNPLEEQFLHRINDTILLSAIGTMVLAFILGTILSRTITHPILELTKATHEIASGKFDQQVSVRSRDEIGELAESFNKMSSDLARSLNLRKQMTADIAHELRTPLSLIIGHAEAVHDGVLPPSAENFEIIREEAERLEKLVNDLRTLSLADAGELSVEFQIVDVNQLLKDIQTHYLIPFANKGVTLDLQIDSNPLKANLDPSRFSQALTNILDNALRHTPEEGRVGISARRVENEVEVSIADNGEGVSLEEAAHIFDRFYRTDKSRTRDGESGGSGLGLAITKSVIEMHKGRIWAESEKGNGLKMIVRLPLASG